MLLKSIEIQGFKSFANKIRFDFDAGITGIVGPNGSGKSNVADAVRWVLGEQSAKLLRGSSMQDVIFAGTENRRPQGFAYVAITFDNSDRTLAIDNSEVTVSRRLFRSGESEYMLNGSLCRLRDINELFYDTGIGREGYSIIGQGQIDKVLSDKPEDRRALFDEAAGIVKYKKRKEEAQKKLENEEKSLERVNDILNEQEKQLKSLKKQSETAAEYLRLRDEKKDLDLLIFSLEEADHLSRLSTVCEAAENARAEITKERENSAKLGAEYDSLQKSIHDLDLRLESGTGRLSDINVEAEAASGRIGILNEQIKADEAQKTRAQERAAAVKKDIEEMAASLDQAGCELARSADEIASLKKQIAEAEPLMEELRAQAKALEEKTGSRRASLYETMSSGADVSAEMQRYETLIEQNEIRTRTLETRIQTRASESQRQQMLLEELSGQRDGLAGQSAKLLESINELERQQRSGQETYKSESQNLNAARQQYNTYSAKLESLKNIAERYEGYGGSVKRVMEQKGWVPGIIGVAADLLETEKRYETAVETALGRSIQDIVTDTAITAKTLIGYLKKERLGRATFLPLDCITAPNGITRADILGETGVIGTADQLVRVKGGYTELARYLLGRTLVVDNIDNAIAIAAKYRQSVRIVTLDGELLSPGGSMTGGAYKNSSSLLGRRREIEELESSCARAKKRRDEIALRVQAAEEKADRTARSLEDARAGLQDARLKIASLDEKITAARSRCKELADQSEKDNAELLELKSENAALKDQFGGLKEQSEQLEQSRKDNESKIETAEKEAQQKQSEVDSLKEQCARLQVRLAQCEQDHAFAGQNAGRLKADMNALKKEQEELAAQLDEAAAAVDEKRAKAAKEEIRLYGLRQRAADAKNEADRLTEERGKALDAQHGLFKQREELLDTISTMEKELYRLQTQQEKLTEAHNSRLEYIKEEYGMSADEAQRYRPLKDLSLTAATKQRAAAKQALKALGPVNVNALDEYKEVSEEYFFTSGQRDDIETARGTLLGLIDELDRGMEEQFAGSFAQISAEFDKVFKEIFGGGQGSVELVDEGDLLSSGIQITAQPPGKKLQNMMQLSGGEKALTAICLLFAIQRLHPSPFCLLDEIEAALDDINVDRFAVYLDSLKDKIQFIVITHRRGTMVKADRLYGITMQEKGVSVMVSADLTEWDDAAI